jgi:hypothetical protein
MAFDIDKMTSFSISAIRAFSERHQSETFYAFAIDASMLCLNSEECAAATLTKYRDKWIQSTRELQSINHMTEADKKESKFVLDLAAKYKGLNLSDAEACLAVINRSRARRREEGCTYFTPQGVLTLRENTGDWEYQGFARLDEKHGFDHLLYSEHYDAAAESDDGHAPDSDYAKAMTSLVSALIAADAFSCLKRSSDFKISWVDHDY